MAVAKFCSAAEKARFFGSERLVCRDPGCLSNIGDLYLATVKNVSLAVRARGGIALVGRAEGRTPTPFALR